MRQSDLEPGTIYASATGNIRELVELDSDRVLYRLVHLERPEFERVHRREIGAVYGEKIQNFCRWAVREVA